jgi:predicted transcriptional regulator
MPERYRIGETASNPLRPTIITRDTGGKEDKVRSMGVTLRESEISRLGLLAEDLGVSRNALARYLLKWAMGELEAGRLQPETEEKVTIELHLP